MDRNPTAENIAAHIHEMTSSAQLPIAEIRLWETPNSYATYRAGSNGHQP
jgi:6-pyruvoyltetrahydropterin/6-carboxytetrahydropterin synthase